MRGRQLPAACRVIRLRPLFTLVAAGPPQSSCLTRAALIPGGRMGSEALEILPVVRCPGCEEPMQPKGAAPVTRELDDISYVCPKCGAETKRTMKRA
jgi:hypothetical protein